MVEGSLHHNKAARATPARQARLGPAHVGLICCTYLSLQYACPVSACMAALLYNDLAHTMRH